MPLDTTRVDHLSVYGYPRTTSPNLYQLATGTLFAGSMRHGKLTFTPYRPVHVASRVMGTELTEGNVVATET